MQMRSEPDNQNSVISFVISKWLLPELSFSDRWSKGTRLWERDWNNLDFLPIQIVRQYHFYDVAKYEKISPKESVDIKEFRPK